MSYDDGLSYLGDGVYASWWNWDSDAEEEKKERERREHSLIVEQLTLQWLQSVDNPKFTANDLLNSMFTATMKTGLFFAMRRYCQLESIHLKYADAIYRECKPADLIVSKLKRYNLFMGVEEVMRLDLFIEELKEYRNDLTAYLKVHEIQLLIHREMQIINGANSHLRMEKSLIREVLSSLRLFFLAEEAKKMNLSDFINYSSQYKNIIKNIKSFIPKYTIESDAKYNENWSSQHQHTLLYYLPEDMREFVKKLVQLRNEQSKKKICEEIKRKVTSYHIQI